MNTKSASYSKYYAKVFLNIYEMPKIIVQTVLFYKLAKVFQADVTPLAGIVHLMLQAFIDLAPTLFVNEVA